MANDELEDIRVDAKPIPTDKHVDTRDFRIEAVTLISASGTHMDIRSLVPEIQIRQDMFLGFMSGELLVVDGIDLLAQLSVHGGEYVYIHIKVPEQSIELRKAFRVYKVGERVRFQENSQRYTLFVVSNELYEANAMDRVSKAYQNMALTAMAEDVLLNVLKLPSNKTFVDPSSSPDTLIIPYMTPLACLNWLASRCYDSKKHSWFFYENFEGFHFKSLSSIYSAPKPIKVPFTLENKKVDPSLDMDKFGIDEMEVHRDFDALSTLIDGGHGMRLDTINVVSRTISTTTYNPSSSITKLYDKGTAMSNTDRVKSGSYLNYLDGHGIQEYIKRVMSLAALNSNLTEIVVPGNMGVQAGTILSIRVPYTITPAEGDMWSRQKSGKYLCFATNHKFNLTAHKYTTLAYLSRDSQPDPLPPADTTLADRIKSLNK